MRNVTVFRGRTQVFAGLTLRIEEGCNTAILGPNGAGKSTLLKMVAGELFPVFSPDSHVKVLGRERWNVWDLRSHLGIVSHDMQHEYLPGTPGLEVILSGFYSSVGTWRNQSFGQREHRRAEEVMERLGIEALRARAFGSMSTGEQRRFLLGRALVNDPGTLLLDEPTSGLDLRTSFLYRDLLRELARKGTTILLVTHHVCEIPSEVQHVVLLKQGRVLAQGRREDMLTSEKLSELFDCPLHAVSHNGTCQVFPAA
ncbi:MAG: ATP-binding cassette domain-containing protein [Gaiellales bacterium]|nr:ATP-binding cassette domain-containing protein [Gaiellales bacterium]